MPAAPKPPADWSALLIDAVQQPGVISSAYSRVWNFSVGNQLLAWIQCIRRGLELGPIHTYQGWKRLGRCVKKGEKAITLCMPVNIKGPHPQSSKHHNVATNMIESGPLAGDGAERPPARVTLFVYKPHWFVLSQTEGTTYIPVSTPAWDERTALYQLSIDRVPFCHPDGNTQGYAVQRQVAVSPIAFLPHRTLFHEIAHVMLGHTEELMRLDDSEHTAKNLREVEAECVALICGESLDLPGIEFSRGYVQHWLAGESISDKSAHRIFKAADRILKAGYPQTTDQ